MTGNQKTASTLRCLTQTNRDNSFDQIIINQQKLLLYLTGIDQTILLTFLFILIFTYINSLDIKVLFRFTET